MADERGKYKGLRSGGGGRRGLSRLRRAAEKGNARLVGWERHAEDDAFAERHPTGSRASHTGESLLARFNRLAGVREDAQDGGARGEICATAGADLLVRGDDGRERPCSVRRALLKRIGGVRNPLCIGDVVRCESDPEDATRGVVTAVLPRRNQLTRAGSHNRALDQIVAANLDRLVIACALAEPDCKPGVIDRWLVLAHWHHIPAAVVLTKADRADPALTARMTVLYASLGVPTFALGPDSPADAEGLAGLHRLLASACCVIVGQSGVGKSTLINRLWPGAVTARTAHVAAAGFGRHTTVTARSYLLPGGTRLVDTPGVRECGIAPHSGLTPLDLALHCPDLARFHADCRFTDCTHRREPGCAVRDAVERGDIAASRYASYVSMVNEDLAL